METQSSPEAEEPQEARSSFPGILVMGLWFALTAGVLEGVWRMIQRFVLGRMIRLPLDIVWMAPAVDAAWLLVPTLLFIVGRRLVPHRISPTVVAGVLSGFAVLPVLLLIPSMHKGVATLLAAGVGAQLGRWIVTHQKPFARMVQITLPILASLVVVGAALVVGTERLAERAAASRWPAAPSGKPNVLLLVWDTVRNDELSIAGYSRPTTPFLESVVGDGVRFERALSTAPWTLPSHGSMFTGQWPHVFFRGTKEALDWSSPTLAETLSRAGYRTAGFTGNLAYTTREQRVNRGFQHYEDFSRTLGTALAWSRISWVILDQQVVRRVIGYYDAVDRKRAGLVNASFLRWLDRTPSRPFFVFLNYFDAHAPYIAPSPFRERFADSPRGTFEVYPKPGILDKSLRTPEEQAFWRAEYDGNIASMDDATRQLFHDLGSRGLLDNTIVIITSDHGEQFGEHGLSGHMNSLYRELLHVPLLIRFPPGVPGGKVVPTPVSLRDIPRTVLALAGVAADPFTPGHSLTRFWRDEGPVGPDSLILSELSTSRNARLGPHAVLSNGPYYIRESPDSIELYDIFADPAQRASLHHQPAREADLIRFQRISDSLDALYRQGRIDETSKQGDENDGDDT